MHLLQNFVGLTLCFGAVSLSTVLASPVVYESTGTDLFGTMDLGTGQFNLIGNSGSLLSGLGVSGNALYGGLWHASALETVNTGSGALTSIGSGSSTYADTGSTLSGLYGVDVSGNLFSINAATGATTLIGPTGLTLNMIALSTNSSTLYFTDAGSLYTLNTTTGAATLVGALVNTNGIGAMIFINGTLYGGDNTNHAIDTINTTSGLATIGPAQTGTTSLFWGLAPQLTSSTPEPGTFGILGASIAGLALLRRRIRRG